MNRLPVAITFGSKHDNIIGNSKEVEEKQKQEDDCLLGCCAV
jgi:hypothetical protein